MGNRAAVVFTNKDQTEISPAIYLHWNGGPESIYAFLQELRRRRCTGDVSYTSARFVHVVGDFFDQDEATACSLGIEPPPAEISTDGLASLANQADDNGVYVVSPGEKDFNVRRFVLEDGVKELSKRAVAAEKKAALKHPYNAGRPIGELNISDLPFPIKDKTDALVAADRLEEMGRQKDANRIRNFLITIADKFTRMRPEIG